ncbi:MAG TPA: hypothetical protein VEP68_06975 [Anaeromyxobacteraceae bacterium]|nr:hypothetical protein [Anaeromyxobacteraceae bacterium]
MAQRLKLGEIIVQSGMLTWEQLEEGLRAQMVYGGRLGTVLVELGLVTEDALAKVLSEQLRLPVASREQLDDIPAHVLKLLTPQQAERLHAIPFHQEGRRLDVALVDPSPDVMDEVQFTTSMTIRPHIAPEVYLTYMLEKHYGIPRLTRYIRLVDDDPMFRKSHPPATPPAGPAGPAAVPVAPPAAPLLEIAPPPPAAAPVAAPGPVAASTPPPRGPAEPALAACVQQLLAATSEKDVLDAAVRFAGGYFERMAVLVGSEDRFRPVRAVHVDLEALKALQIPRDEPLLETLFGGGGVRTAPLPPALQGLGAAMGEGPDSAVSLAPLFSTRWRGLLVGAGPRFAMAEADLRRFALLREKVTMALDILALRRRLETLPEDLG